MIIIPLVCLLFPKAKLSDFTLLLAPPGKPTVVAYSRKDINIFAEVVTRALCCSGVTRNDIVQVAFGYGLFTGGLGLHYGAEKLGAAVVPISGGNTAKQITLLQDFGSTVLVCTPSYAAYLAESIAEAGIDPKAASPSRCCSVRNLEL